MHILRHLQTVRRPAPPIDPYARGGVVPPMKTAQKMSYAALANDTGGPLWGVPPYRGPDPPAARQPGGGAGVAVGAGAGARA